LSRTASGIREAAGDLVAVEIDDILGEISAPVKVEAEDEPAYSLDEILGEFDAPTQGAKGNSLDDVVDEIVPRPVKPRDHLDDNPGGIAAPVKAGPSALPDALQGKFAQPSRDGTVECLEDLVGAIAPVAEAKPAKGCLGTFARLATIPEAADGLPGALGDVVSAGPVAAERRRLAFFKIPDLPGLSATRQISRKTYLGMVGLIGLLGIIAVAETAFILIHGVGQAETKPKTVVVTMAPVNYAHIDLQRYMGKRRALHEGGREVLRNEAVKEAILELENGEELYRDVRAIARRSPAADRMTIADDLVTVVSCENGACGDRSFRLVYDLVRKHASICMTEKYLNNSTLSYSYSEAGYSEVKSCR
jgi:hypothetical protein